MSRKWEWNEAAGIETPCVIINSDAVDHNIAVMAEAVGRSHVQLRPHAKTHKLPEMSQRQISAGATGITVAKVSEAEVMAAGGVKDIFIAYPLISPGKINRAIKLAQSGIRLIVGVDSLEGAERVSAVASQHGTVMEVRLEIDSGLRRTGVDTDAAAALARQIAALNGISLTGIFTYRGSMLNGSSSLDIRAAGHEEGRFMAETATKIREAGIDIKDVSVGSTQTSIYAAEIEGVTEVRPGTYIYQDRMQMAFGACSADECAGAVWATVVSRPTEDRIVIDGGSKTFATDVQPGNPPLNLQGFGHIVGAPEAVFERMNEEHGVIRIPSSSNYKVGDVIAIIPNHICSTVNLHNFVYVEETNGNLRKVPVAARGMLE